MVMNVITNTVYVGQSSNVKKRLRDHKSLLNRKSHYNNAFQEHWVKYGEKGFTFNILELVEFKENLDDREHFWTSFYKYNTSCNVYNINTGRRLSEETKQKISLANLGNNNQKYWLGKHRTEEQKQKQSLAMIGKMSGEKHPMWGKEGVWKGKTRPDDFKKKVSESLKGHDVSLESRKKMSEAKKGKDPHNKFIITEELIKDIENGISYKCFEEKYGKSKNTIKRIKQELKGKKRIRLRNMELV